MTSSSATWPHYVLDMVEGDTLLMFDVRRYETNLQRLAELAAERGVSVILITDQWSSPINSVAAHTFNCWVEIPSAWDSNISTMMLLEAMISAAQEERWTRPGRGMKSSIPSSIRPGFSENLHRFVVLRGRQFAPIRDEKRQVASCLLPVSHHL